MCTPPRNPLDPGIEPRSPALWADFLLPEPPGKLISRIGLFNSSGIYPLLQICRRTYSTLAYVVLSNPIYSYHKIISCTIKRFTRHPTMCKAIVV